MQRSVMKTLTCVMLLLMTSQAGASLDEAAQLIEDGRYQEALETLSSQPDSSAALLLRANALAALQQDREAEALYRRLITQSPQNPEPYNNLAVLYARSGKLQEASELLNQGMKSDERYAAIYKNLSRVYVEMSRSSYAKALRLSEKPQGLQLAMLEQATVAEEAPAPQVSEAEAPPVPETVSLPGSEVIEAPEVAVQPASVAETIEPQEPVVALAAVSKSAQEPVAGGSFDGGGVIVALNHWAAAWSQQDVAGYLASYDVNFLPPRDLTREQWQAERRVRLLRPGKIEVRLSDFEVSSTGDSNSLTVKLVQHYRSDNYRDTSRKGFIMVQREGVWKIGDEYTIEVLK